MLSASITLVVICSALQITRSVNVQGPIFAETIWEPIYSPYLVTGDFQVPNNVALIIKPGTQVTFTGDFQILIKGRIDIQGTPSKPVKFIGAGVQKPMLIFKSANLSQSTINTVHFTGPQTAIQLAAESEHGQDTLKNFGILEVNNIVVTNSRLQTNGYDSQASLKIVNSKIYDSTIVGVYPRSEPIMIMNSVIESSTIRSDSYNYGIKINGSTIRDSQMSIGCCSANMQFSNSRLINIVVREGDGSPVSGPVKFESCHINGLNMNLPAAKTSFQSNHIRINNGQTIKVGVANVRCSTFIGNSSDKAMEITGNNGYYPSNEPQSIVQSTFLNFDTALTITGKTISLTIDRSNFIGTTQYSVYSTSTNNIVATNNYWGVNRFDAARSTIYDYYRNIDYGQVLIDPISPTRIANDDC